MTDISESYRRKLQWREAKRELQRYGAEKGIALDENTSEIVLQSLGYDRLAISIIQRHQATIRGDDQRKAPPSAGPMNHQRRRFR